MARFCIAIVARIPAFAIRRTARTLGAVAYFLAPFERRTAQQQLMRHIATTQTRADKISRGVFNHLALSAIELCRLSRNGNTMPKIIIPARSKRALDEALSRGKGVVFITGHMGNWELMAIALSQQGYPIFTTAKKSYDSRFTKLLYENRRRFGVQSFYVGDSAAPYSIVKTLRRNAIVGFLIDQDTNVPGSFVPFFNDKAHTPSGPAKFAMRSGAPVVIGSIKRHCDDHHQITIEPITCSTEKELTATATQILETRIRHQLCQWVWFHRRWKTPPPPGHN